MKSLRTGYRTGMDFRGVAGPLGSAALLAALLAGCGSENAAGLRPTDAEALHSEVAAVRAAVEADRGTAARNAIADLRAAIRRLSAAGGLNEADGKVLLTQVERIEQDLEARPTPTPSRTPVPTPVVEVPADDDDDNGDDDDKGKGKGKDKGKGKGNGDD